MSYGRGIVSRNGGDVSVEVSPSDGVFGQYYETVREYLKTVRQGGEVEDGGVSRVSGVVDGLRSIVPPCVGRCGVRVCGEVDSVCRVGDGVGVDGGVFGVGRPRGFWCGVGDGIGEPVAGSAGSEAVLVLGSGSTRGGAVVDGTSSTTGGFTVGGSDPSAKSSVAVGDGLFSVKDGAGDQVVEDLPVGDAGGDKRGKHYWKNKMKKEKKRLMSQNWRGNRGVDGSGGCISDGSDGGSVRTVDTRTAAEIEAAQSLAVRRVAENKVATALATHKLRVLQDKDRTAMVDRLAAARGEQRINEAMAKSQSSFKKCDQSLKSLGSSGSAGEFALKQEVKKAKDNEAIRLYVEKQAQMFAKYATPDVLQMVAAIPAPVLQDEFEAFGECPSDYGEDEQEAYFDELNRRNEENFDRCATYC